MRRKLDAALALSWGDWWILCQAWVSLLVVDVGLRLLAFQRVQELWGCRDVSIAGAGGPADTIQRLGQLVDMAGNHHLYPMRCLVRSLVLQGLLCQHGVHVDLRFGVQHDEAGLAAHAWLEYQGQPIGQSEGIEGRFVPLVAPRAGR